jgi:hypothetical protein
VSNLQVKIDSDTLLVDPSFGQIILTNITWPQGWGEGQDMNSGIGGGAARRGLTPPGSLLIAHMYTPLPSLPPPPPPPFVFAHPNRISAGT